MKIHNLIDRPLLLAFLLAWSSWGCAGQPFDPPQTDEIPKGPGVFTKDEGGVVLYDSDRVKIPSPASEKPSTQLPNVEDPSSSTTDYEAFEAYKQWLQWKQSAVESGEYEEFQLWREWKQYKDWKKCRDQDACKE